MKSKNGYEVDTSNEKELIANAEKVLEYGFTYEITILEVPNNNKAYSTLLLKGAYGYINYFFDVDSLKSFLEGVRIVCLYERDSSFQFIKNPYREETA